MSAKRSSTAAVAGEACRLRWSRHWPETLIVALCLARAEPFEVDATRPACCQAMREGCIVRWVSPNRPSCPPTGVRPRIWEVLHAGAARGRRPHRGTRAMPSCIASGRAVGPGHGRDGAYEFFHRQVLRLAFAVLTTETLKPCGPPVVTTLIAAARSAIALRKADASSGAGAIEIGSADVSDRTRHGMGGERAEQRPRIGHPAENAALNLHHPDLHQVVPEIGSAAAICAWWCGRKHRC